MLPGKGSIAVLLFKHLYPDCVRETATADARGNGSLVIGGYIKIDHPVITVTCRIWQMNARGDLLHASLVERMEEAFTQRFDKRFLAGPESKEEFPLRLRVGEPGQLQSFVPGHEMTCQLHGVASLLNQFDIDADLTSATNGDQQPVATVGQIEIQILRSWSVKKRFAVFTISVADRTGVGPQVSAKRLPEQIAGNEKVLSCAFHLESCRTGLFLGRKTARRFRDEVSVLTEVQRMYEKF